jgi:hypothetical protein
MRCAECGHGSTFTRLTAVAHGTPSAAQRAALEDRRRQQDAQTTTLFDEANFAPYALDGRSARLRWFGGHGASNGIVTSLSLAFGDSPFDEQTPEVRVTTQLPERPGEVERSIAARMASFMLARQQVEHLWQHTGVLRDEIRRAVFPLHSARSDDPTRIWDHCVIAVDGENVEFAFLSEQRHWVAQAIVGPLLVGITSREWPIDAVGLRSETTFDAYAEGSAQVRRTRHE